MQDNIEQVNHSSMPKKVFFGVVVGPIFGFITMNIYWQIIRSIYPEYRFFESPNYTTLCIFGVILGVLLFSVLLHLKGFLTNFRKSWKDFLLTMALGTVTVLLLYGLLFLMMSAAPENY